jgi:hypothetical protein
MFIEVLNDRANAPNAVLSEALGQSSHALPTLALHLRAISRNWHHVPPSGLQAAFLNEKRPDLGDVPLAVAKRVS